jgi:DNA replicative helicase MCM subunit Mcm2 (Cdc46/Mcm family)
VIPRDVFQAYVSIARTFRPSLTPSIVPSLENLFVEMRRREAEEKRPQTYTTARSLLSIVRLAGAHARCEKEKRQNPSCACFLCFFPICIFSSSLSLFFFTV